MCRHKFVQLLQETPLGSRGALLTAGKNHVQQGQCATTDGYGRTQQAPALVGLQIRPVDQDDRLWPTQQPAGHVLFDAMAFAMQVPIAEQAIKGLQRSPHAHGARPGSRNVTQGQSAALDQCLNRLQQRPPAQGVHAGE